MGSPPHLTSSPCFFTDLFIIMHLAHETPPPSPTPPALPPFGTLATLTYLPLHIHRPWPIPLTPLCCDGHVHCREQWNTQQQCMSHQCCIRLTPVASWLNVTVLCVVNSLTYTNYIILLTVSVGSSLISMGLCTRLSTDCTYFLLVQIICNQSLSWCQYVMHCTSPAWIARPLSRKWSG